MNESSGRKKKELYSGGDGSSIENAIVINDQPTMLHPFINIKHEFKYLEALYKKDKIKFVVQDRSEILRRKRFYERLKIELSNGEKKEFYFDITNFRGKIF